MFEYEDVRDRISCWCWSFSIVCCHEVFGWAVICGDIMFSRCPFVHLPMFVLSVNSFICYYKLVKTIFSEWRNLFGCKFVQAVHRARAWSGQLGVRWSKVKVTWGPDRSGGMAEASFLTSWVEWVF